MKRYVFFFILITLASCRMHKEAASLTIIRKDSSRIEIQATERVVELAIKRQLLADVKISSNERRSAVVASKNTTKQVVSTNKKEVQVAKVESQTKKVEARQEAAVEKKQIQAVIVAKKQVPNIIKWSAIFIAVVIIGWLVIKKKIPFLR